ncbi:NAD(P)-dependent oxidoreductase, partial [Candidatus Daviesbacteria bacterium]|nr:NAD(P)-dependent oxidoreductase [Candidatus Daviesbacteria bacterium]
MDELTVNSNKKTRILLSRNNPVALVVGAAGFLGSNLVDKLLLKNIQVIGVDDLNIGKRENLSNAVEKKNFHLLISSPEKCNLEIDRLDYIFIVWEQETEFANLLELFKKHRARLLFVSSIELYDKGNEREKLAWFKNAEVEVARFAKEHNLNARILRLGSVFGPRMDFNHFDPMIKLIQQSLTGDLQKEVSLEFSSRALYVDDATDLLIKCIFAGATAQKIFDGVATTPVKVSEAKQILLDPVWYESKNFIPTELPPWFTPNLEKTIKFLNWHPQTKLVEYLRKTVNYFKDNEIKVPKLVDKAGRDDRGEEDAGKWKMEKSKELEALKKIGETEKTDSKEDKGDEQILSGRNKQRNKLPKLFFPTRTLAVLAGI